MQGHEHPEEITRALAARDLYVTELSAVRPDLETFFLRLTGHRPRPDWRDRTHEDGTPEPAEAGVGEPA